MKATFFNMFKIAASGMSAQRLRMNIISSNLANANTTRTPEGGPYVRKDVIFSPVSVSEPQDFFSMLFGNILRDRKDPEGVQVVDIIEDKKPFKMVYDPYHPDANDEGYVAYPNINVIEEMVNLLSASRSFEANVTAFNSAKDMVLRTLEIGRV